MTEPAGYIIVERHVTGPLAGRLDADWDGAIHESREAAEAELALANRPLDDDSVQGPAEHWKLYELRPVEGSAEPLRECAVGLATLIAEAKARAMAQGLDPYRALSTTGAPILAPLLVAEAQVLASLADGRG